METRNHPPMKALSFNASLANLSFMYDTLTIYPKTNGSINQQIVLDEITRSLLNLFANVLDCQVKISESLLNKVLENPIMDFDKTVMREDDAHDLYHKDTYRQYDRHFHLKFKHILTPNRFKKILDVLVEQKLLAQNEANLFFFCLKARIDLQNEILQECLTLDIAKDTKTIIQYINKCNNNDILASVHTHLSTEQFNYLRIPQNTTWQGTDKNETVVITSNEWAMIEKAFSLKMAKNIQENCSQFTKTLGQQQAREFAQSHRFFSLKRKTNSNKESNNTYQYLSSGDSHRLEQSYEKHFRKFS